ncbi:hypothetical protein EFD56_28205 [Rhizobium phaseoli]|nr:hypothetical protein EFD56_28205 [Rhizobium phaseoli]
MRRNRFGPEGISAQFSASKKSDIGTGDNKLLILYLVFAATITTRYRKDISGRHPCHDTETRLAARLNVPPDRNFAPWGQAPTRGQDYAHRTSFHEGRPRRLCGY